MSETPRYGSSDVIHEFAEVIGEIESGAARRGLENDWLVPWIFRLWEVFREVEERERRATDQMHKEIDDHGEGDDGTIEV